MRRPLRRSNTTGGSGQSPSVSSLAVVEDGDRDVVVVQ